MDLKIADRLIGDAHPTYFVADIAANHDGSLERAMLLIRLAKEAGADAANHLEDGVRQNSLIRHAAFNTFGHELLCVLLEVAVFRTVLHCFQ